MSWQEFITAREAYQANIAIYITHLPLWVNVWRGWMFVLFTSSLLFAIWRVEARWFIAITFLSVQAYDLLGTFIGVSRFLSVALLLPWIPLAIYVYRRLPNLPRRTLSERFYMNWLRVVLVTLLISISFDTYNVIHFLAVRS